MVSVYGMRLLAAASHLDDLAASMGVRVTVLEATMYEGTPCCIVDARHADNDVFAFCQDMIRRGYKVNRINDGRQYISIIQGEAP